MIKSYCFVVLSFFPVFLSPRQKETRERRDGERAGTYTERLDSACEVSGMMGVNKPRQTDSSHSSSV